ncbi:OmpA family protein [Shewanella sp. 0m-4]
MKTIIKPVHILLFSLLGMHSAVQAVEQVSAAQDTAAVDNTPSFDSHFYLGAKAGYSSMENSCHSSYQDCDISALAYGIFTGYQFTPWFAVELGVTDYQDYDAIYAGHNVNADIMGYDAAVKLSLPLTEDGLSAYVKAGTSYMDITRTSIFVLPDPSGFTALGAIGLEYALSQSTSLRVEYQYLPDVGGSQSHFTSLAFSYRFGDKPKPITVVAKPAKAAVIAPTPVVNSIAVTPQVMSVLFGFDSSQLSAQAKTQLEAVAEKLAQQHALKVMIVGHTDFVGPQTYNLTLSKARAGSIADYLIAKGISASRISLKGAGEAEPIASNTNAAGRASNRRVEIRF